MICIKKLLVMAIACVACVAQGQNVDALLRMVKAEMAPDGRTAIWRVNRVMQNGVVTLTGEVDSNATYEAIDRALTQNGVEYKNNIVVLENSQRLPWALVKLPVASMRVAGRHSAEMATQSIMGTPVKLLDEYDGWCLAQTPDRYISYVPANSLYKMGAEDMEKWRQAKRYIVTAFISRLVQEPGSDETVSDLTMGNILEYRSELKSGKQRGKWLELATPDGRTGWISTADVRELREWASQEFDAAFIEKTARRMTGSGYLWGGTSAKLTDCSGMVKVSYFANAVILQRDASQQALTGIKLDSKDWRNAELGDLLFFGTRGGKVTHVGMYLRDGKYIHCSGQVKINSLDPEDELFLTTPFLSISRINGAIGTEGIVAVKNHPWYF